MESSYPKFVQGQTLTADALNAILGLARPLATNIGINVGFGISWGYAGAIQAGRLVFGSGAALDQFGRDAFVMWMAGAHYRKPVAYTEEALEDAARAVARVKDVVRRLDSGAPGLDEYLEKFFDALADDFNTPQARAVLFDWVAEANRRMDAGERVGPGRLEEMLWGLGLEALLEVEEEAPEELQRLAAEREDARASRDFERADRIRNELAEAGWEIRDTPEGARLVRAP